MNKTTTQLLRNINQNILNKFMDLSTLDVDNQMQFLRSLPAPKDLLQRSYFQYLCQMKTQPYIYNIAQNIAALILLPIYFFILMILSIRNDTIPKERKNCAIFFHANLFLIPVCLKNEYSEIISCKVGEKMRMSKQERFFITNLINKYWHAPYFIFKCMLKICTYCGQIIKFNPEAIIASCEYSFTSSILTEYCHQRGVEHINIMHGEKLLHIRDSFVQYDRFYVWDEHYISLLTDLRADKDQFRVALPSTLRLECTNPEKLIYNYTYFLQYTKKDYLLKVKQSLLSLHVNKEKICVRYHPLHSDKKIIRQIFKDFIIENPHEVSLAQSLSMTESAIAAFSTVLYQAYVCSKTVVIDDITNIEEYKKLKKMRYIMLEKPHKKLSELI
ncbi:MAG: hypothetical protein WAW41_16185 [Methylobacter sp.]